MSNYDKFSSRKREREEKVLFIIKKHENPYKKTQEIKPSSRKMIEKVLEETEKEQSKVENKSTTKAAPEKKPKTDSLGKFTMDSEGRVIDEKGNIVSIVHIK